MKVPRPIQSTALVEFAVTSPIFIHLIISIMQTPNGQNPCLDIFPASATNDTRKVSKINKSLWPAQAEFLDFIMFNGITELSKSLKLIHDLALYHSDIPIDEVEKSALFDLKILLENFEKILKEL